MVTTVGWFYLLGGTVLFFFWAYGIVSFVLDVKNKFVPAAKGLMEKRREQREQTDREQEREEREQQLY